MKVVFRVDASIEMGIGHAMRCLTLADALRVEGAECHFICREHPGNLIKQIASRGYQVDSLPLCQSNHQGDGAATEESQLTHAHWLGCDWRTDARQTTACIASLNYDWLVVDHYALDERWEKQLRPICSKIMVIDDLADRYHDCDLLLDQTHGRSEVDYEQRTPISCTLLTGAKYALLRPEFAVLREYSLQRRKEPRLEHLLISMGGADKDNVTGKVLQALKGSYLPEDCHVSVVMGEDAPWLEDVKNLAGKLPWVVEINVNVINMAQLMADSDLAIGAAGSTTWERCCLGLPTLMLILAENQRDIARALLDVKAVLMFDGAEQFSQLSALSTDVLKNMSCAASEITDGSGTGYVTRHLKEM
ncbi:MAG: UDP-2,4-diacetamido-2,4,6-trideoxy-beta-L-altropyranose hydrolase [Gimesia sp.]